MLDPSWQGSRGEGANIEKPQRQAEVEESGSLASLKVGKPDR